MKIADAIGCDGQLYRDLVKHLAYEYYHEMMNGSPAPMRTEISVLEQYGGFQRLEEDVKEVAKTVIAGEVKRSEEYRKKKKNK